MVAVTIGSAIRTHSLSKKKNNLSCLNGSAKASAEMIYGRTRLVIPRRRVREIVGRIETGSRSKARRDSRETDSSLIS